MIKLTLNEKKVLSLLLEKGNITNTEICSRLKISKQAVGMIRKKLEDNKLIKGYSINLDLKILGIDIFCIIKIKFKVFNNNFHNEIRKWINTKNDIITAHAIFLNSPGIVMVCGFQNLDKLNLFVRELSENPNVTVDDVLISNVDDVLKDSNEELVKGHLKSLQK